MRASKFPLEASFSTTAFGGEKYAEIKKAVGLGIYVADCQDGSQGDKGKTLGSPTVRFGRGGANLLEHPLVVQRVYSVEWKRRTGCFFDLRGTGTNNANKQERAAVAPLSEKFTV